MRKCNLWAITAFCLLVAMSAGCKSAQAVQISPTDDSSQFVNITDVVPDALLEIRYFSTYNFVGARIDGMSASHATLTTTSSNYQQNK